MSRRMSFLALAVVALAAAGAKGATASSRNQAPVPVITVTNVVAGTFGGARYYLSGSGSYDPDGTIVSYTWTTTSQCHSGYATSVTDYTVEAYFGGHCKVTLTVTDAQGAKAGSGFAFNGSDAPLN